jgi:transcription initiation factor IIE alpha subunit
MKLDSKIKKLIEKNSFSSVLNSVMRGAPLEKLMLEFSNQCVFKANASKTRKAQRSWYNIARVFHRAYDEMILEKTKKVIFKVNRRDIYLCPKCKKKFKVDAAKEENCKFELDRGFVVAKCPNCGFTE